MWQPKPRQFSTVQSPPLKPPGTPKQNISQNQRGIPQSIDYNSMRNRLASVNRRYWARKTLPTTPLQKAGIPVLLAQAQGKVGRSLGICKSLLKATRERAQTRRGKLGILH